MAAVLQQQLRAAGIRLEWSDFEDLANVVAFLASDEASYVTGQTVSVSGGLTMS